MSADEQRTTARWIQLAEDGPGPEAYLVAPADGPARGAVIVGAEMFGVTGFVRGVCHRLAGQGYAALAPDFYWRTAPRADFGYDDDSHAAAYRLMTGLRRDEALADLAAAHAAAAGHAGGVAAVGFSLGGHLAVLGATSLRLDLVVSYYGGWLLDGGLPLAEPVPPAAESAAIAGNVGFLLAFLGDQDFLMKQEQWGRLGERFRDAGVAHELVTYPGVGHGFACDDRPENYHAEAAEDAWARTLEALERHVGQQGAGR